MKTDAKANRQVEWETIITNNKKTKILMQFLYERTDDKRQKNHKLQFYNRFVIVSA